MRSPALETLDALVGRWTLTLSSSPFFDGEVHGSAAVEWLGDAFLVLRSDLDGQPLWDLVIGRSDAREAYTVLYHDERGVLRVFAMTFDDGTWTLVREDPDFHQRFVARVAPDRLDGRWEMSQDQGGTWRKDFDVTFVRSA